MKPAESTVTAVSTVASGAQAMTIDPKGMAVILDTLTNLYSDGSLAVVREYASNARDSHVEAGNPDPILVTSPGHLNPILTVQDFGTGLSEDEMLNVYARYGASTKRDTNAAIGSFGIGAKSAFTVGSQFTVTAVKDGRQVIALFALDGDGAPTVNILSNTATIEPNGVKVEIGVRDVDGVRNAIDRLFATWPKGSVLVDGVEPACIWDDTEALADDIHLKLGDRYEAGWTVVMGGVPYSLPMRVRGMIEGRAHQVVNAMYSSQVHVYLTVPIGAVDITPSREDLRDTAHTTETVTAMVEKFANLINAWASKRIDNCNSPMDAAINFYRLRTQFGGYASHVLDHVTWRGRPLPTGNVKLDDTCWFHLKRRGYYGDTNARRETGLILSPDAEIAAELFVTDVPEKRVRSVQNAAKPYLMSQKGTEGGHKRVVALVGDPAQYKQDWFDVADPAIAKIKYDDFTAKWKPVAQASGTRPKVVYAVRDMGGSSTADGDTLKAKGAVWYLTGDDQYVYRMDNPLLKEAAAGKPIVLLTKTQKDTMLVKRVPQARHLIPEMERTARRLLRLSKADADAVAAENFLRAASGELAQFLTRNRSRITNKAVLDVLALRDQATAASKLDLSRMNLLRYAARKTGTELSSLATGSALKPEAWERIEAGLPLLDAYLSWRGHRSTAGDEDAILYINSKNL